ncbi:MAG: HEPN domain-containing protein [Methanosarcinales archaeon]
MHDNKRFIEYVVNTRNFLTHYDKNIEMKAKTGQELYRLVQKMKFILEICFLIELEMPMETIKALVFRNQRYQYIAKQ